MLYFYTISRLIKACCLNPSFQVLINTAFFRGIFVKPFLLQHRSFFCTQVKIITNVFTKAIVQRSNLRITAAGNPAIKQREGERITLGYLAWGLEKKLTSSISPRGRLDRATRDLLALRGHNSGSHCLVRP